MIQRYWLPGVLAAASFASAGELQFNRDVRPILSENCFHCHGQDQAHREAGLRLDTLDGLLGKGEAGDPIVVRGKPSESLLWQRITSTDPDDVMPPPDSHRTLTRDQVAVLRQWIEEGAPFEEHWAFQAPRKAQVDAASPEEAIDLFVDRGIKKKGLTPSAPADPATWLRRASFDLTGLAPAPEDVAAFEAEVAEFGERAYEDAAARLLASSRFGEHMAAAWLDVARYADTHGYNNDSERHMWRWRDWVIDAFNRNLPYDQFIIQQLAGDLLPEPTIDSRLATGFNRNHVINSEGGIIDEEYRAEYVADRVRTVGTAWLGLTLDCARCHDHKYDRISQRDYFEMYAFFNQVPEVGEAGRLRNAAPLMRAPTRDQQEHLADLEQRIGRAFEAVPEPAEDVAFTPPAAAEAENVVRHGRAEFPAEGDHPSLDFRPAGGAKYTFLTWLRWDGGEGVVFSSINYGGEPSAQGYGRGVELRVLEDGRLDYRVSERWPGYATQLISATSLQPGQWHAVALRNDGSKTNEGVRLFVDFREEELELVMDGLSGGGRAGKMVLGRAAGGTPQPLQGGLAKTAVWPEALEPEAIDRELEATLQPDAPWATGRADLVTKRAALAKDPAYRDAFVFYRDLYRERLALIRSFPNAMVMEDQDEPRPTHILIRGMYDQPGDLVEPGVMEELLAGWPEGAPRNRLGLAEWLTDPQHPLTSRVVVNRFWQQVFGTGLVKTVDDFGVQGEFPTHPDLLDWLARDFIDNHWDVKRLLRGIVLSDTYRRESRRSPADRQADPANRYLAAGPRVRLPAEAIRDHALHVSGLLVEEIGGPSVRPFQPEGYYDGTVVGANYPGTTWTDGEGDDLFRRSLYTFWKRTVPHPVLSTFDTPDREFCVATRSATNTPLQALILMNEKGFLHAAAGLGERLRAHGGDDPAATVAYGFELVTGRKPDAREARTLQAALDESLADWTSDPEGARAFLAECGVTDPQDPGTEAAYAMLAHLLLNLDETLTKY